MSERPVTVVFTGQVRDRDVLLRALESLHGIPAIVRFVLATGQAAATEHRLFLEKLAERYGLIVAGVPDTPDWSGNMLAQMMGLYIALSHVPPDHLVLKTRTDVVLEPNAVRHMLAQDRALSLPSQMRGGGAIFDEKVGVWGIEATSPFYIHDLFFFATRRDVTKLVNMDVRYDLLYRMTKEKIHVRRFLHPFLNDYPIFERFLYVENVLGITVDYPNEYRHLVLAKMLANDTYVTMMALYYQLVSAYFTNDWGTGQVFTWRDMPDQVAFDPTTTLSQFFADRRTVRAILPLGNRFFHNVAGGHFAPCDLGARFRRANAYLDSLADLRDACQDFDLDAFRDAALDAGRSALDAVEQRLKGG